MIKLCRREQNYILFQKWSFVSKWFVILVGETWMGRKGIEVMVGGSELLIVK